ncbi:MAG TPA: lysophospholipid acyltransferase family protein [Puia sp.]|uniref:lysophospholipid acyltransferase family protein n=1 Tax=Puia sp. TaxID=2045100 RepID=UPI002BF57B21|nr:lysophospholipid acyltransferase family protein [Puia sp.]HVU98866.1 lysophospholipid acyltransferase family protein [Puia sp.]
MYYLVYGVLYGLSLLPMWLLYGFSDGIAFLLYAVIRYRRGVVLSNLVIAFPEKTDAERLRIAKRFYRNFTDNFIETLKLLSAGPDFLERRLVIDNPELLDYYYDQGRKLHAHLGHLFNWEIGNAAIPRLTRYPFLVAYMPVENKVFERLFLHLRSRTGSIPLPATRLQRAILPYRNQQYILALVADQAPGGPENSYWLNFFGRPTPFVRGPERGARIADIPAIFVRFYKVRRGHYRAELITIAEHPGVLPEGELTRRYCRLLEDAIRRQPDSWLWSHKRWKFGWNPELQPFWIDDEKNTPTT